jgi:nitrate reductase NapE component
MQRKSENQVEESAAAFAFAIVLLNILTIAAVGGLLWLLQMIITLNSPFNTVLREMAWM